MYSVVANITWDWAYAFSTPTLVKDSFAVGGVDINAAE